MIDVLELVLGVDPAVDPDVARATIGGDRQCFGQVDRGRRREQSADPIARSERLEDRDATDDGEDTRGDEEEGSHGGDHSGPSVGAREGRRGVAGGGRATGSKRPEGTYSRRGR